MQPSCKQKLAGPVGPDNFSDAIVGPVSHCSNASEHSIRSQTAACPTNAEQVRSVVRLAMALGGIPPGEHGIGVSKAAHMGPEHGSAAMELAWALKRSCDPNNILDPGWVALDG